MSETITAWENVCRDFSWLGRIDPRVVQGILTLLAALVASATAIYIAKWVYPQQKNIDRRNEVFNEKREAYRKFLTAMNSLYTAVLDKDKAGALTRMLDLHAVASDMACFASPEVAVFARDYLDKVQKFRSIAFALTPEGKLKSQKEWSKAKAEAEQARVKVIAAIRMDLFEGSAIETQSVVAAFFPKSYKGEESK